jgi:hypothetical protein
MSADDLVFWIIVVVVFGPWLYLMSRYAEATRRYDAELRRSEGSRLAPLFAGLRGGIFRESDDPETEAARREALRQYRLMERYFLALLSIMLGLILVVAVVIVIHGWL